MPDDAKKILSDLEKGKLPDIKTSSSNSNKDLTHVRYTHSYTQYDSVDKDDGALYHSYCYFTCPPTDRHEKPDSRTNGGVAVKEQKKDKQKK